MLAESQAALPHPTFSPLAFAIGDSSLAFVTSTEEILLFGAGATRSIALPAVANVPGVVFDGTRYLVIAQDGFGIHQRTLTEDGVLGDEVFFPLERGSTSRGFLASDEVGTVLLVSGEAILIDEITRVLRVVPGPFFAPPVWFRDRFWLLDYANAQPKLVSVSTSGVVEQWPVEIPTPVYGSLLVVDDTLTVAVEPNLYVADPTLHRFDPTSISFVGQPSGHAGGVLVFQRTPVEDKRFELFIRDLSLDGVVRSQRSVGVDGPVVTVYACNPS